jgi:uncharacterized protein YqjF (DUF2071 family)
MLTESSHVPGAARRGPFLFRQGWRDLLFAHWPVAQQLVRDRLPRELELDVWTGSAWVGVVPFRLVGLRPRWLPGLPTATDFLELNVRTYVRVDGSPGVYFFSLDASSSLAVLGARTMFGLPYYRAEMRFARDGEWVTYYSRRRNSAAVFEGRYRPTGFEEVPKPGSLEEFLVERYRLFTVHDGQIRKLEIDHPPWPLRPAEARINANTMALAAGIPLPDQEPLVHFVVRQDVLTGPPVLARR